MRDKRCAELGNNSHYGCSCNDMSLRQDKERWRELHDLKVEWLDAERVRCADLMTEIQKLKRELAGYAYTQKGYDEALNGERLARSIAEEALEDIANQDFRGPRPREQHLALEALRCLRTI